VQPGSPDRLVAGTADVCIGEFRCPTGHPAFRNSGPASHYCVAFPRTAVTIRHGDTRVLADPTIATLYNEGQEYEREPVSRDGDRCEWFGVSPRLLRAIVAVRDSRAADDPRRPIRFTHAPVGARLYLAQRQAYAAAAAGSRDPLWLEETVVALMERVFDAAYGTPAPPLPISSRTRELVHHAQCVIACDAARDLGLAEIADGVGVSMAHLTRAVRAVTGRTLHAYRGELRLRGSLETLASHGRNLTDVALEHGYSSHSHFTAAFGRSFGVTPSAARTSLERMKTRPE
jgi:AraC-like DNA-binding protein